MILVDKYEIAILWFLVAATNAGSAYVLFSEGEVFFPSINLTTALICGLRVGDYLLREPVE